MPKLAVNEKCTGCGLCELVCSFQHYRAFNPKRARLRVKHTFPIPTPPVFCVQCEKKSCLESCPEDALNVAPGGEIKLDQEKCTQCGLCIDACEYMSAFYDEKSGYPLICDMCSGSPACVDYCPTSALAVIREEQSGDR